MVQVIQSGPSTSTYRQAALEDALKTAAGGFSQMEQLRIQKDALAKQDAQTAKQDATTRRQQALQNIAAVEGLRSAGYDVTPEQFAQATGQAQVYKGEILPDLFGKRTPEYMQKQEAERQKLLRDEEDRKLDREFKQEQIELGKFKRRQDTKNPSLVVPGLGTARTESEAKEMRQTQADAEDAGKIIDQIKLLGTDVDIFDRNKIAKIDQLKTVLAGKLRLPLTGPGAMTEDEFQRLIGAIGDPSTLFGTENIEMSKLDQLKGILGDSVRSKFSSMGLERLPDRQLAPNGLALSPVDSGTRFNPSAKPQGLIPQAQAAQVLPRHFDKASKMGREEKLKLIQGR